MGRRVAPRLDYSLVLPVGAGRAATDVAEERGEGVRVSRRRGDSSPSWDSSEDANDGKNDGEDIPFTPAEPGGRLESMVASSQLCDSHKQGTARRSMPYLDAMTLATRG